MLEKRFQDAIEINDRPNVSIIVPTYNVEKYAKICFDSLLNQTLKDIEIILVDDGSTDLSGKICHEYAMKDPRVKVIHQINKGLGFSRNSGIDMALGEYIGFVDADDCVSKSMFEILYKNAQKYMADISYCTYEKFAYESEIVDKNNDIPEIKIWSGQKEIHQYLLDRIGFPPQMKKDKLYGASACCGIFLRKRLIKLNAKFVSEKQFIAEDMIFDIDVIPYCERIVHCDVPLYYYRYNPNSLTTVYKSDRFEKNVQLYYEMYRRLSDIYSTEECFNSMTRYLLTVARIAVIQEARFIVQNGWNNSYANIKKICENTEIQKILRIYEYKKLPFKYRVTCYLLKVKSAFLLLVIYYCYCRGKQT